jgi:hypothetical protein
MPILTVVLVVFLLGYLLLVPLKAVALLLSVVPGVRREGVLELGSVALTVNIPALGVAPVPSLLTSDRTYHHRSHPAVISVLKPVASLVGFERYCALLNSVVNIIALRSTSQLQSSTTLADAGCALIRGAAADAHAAELSTQADIQMFHTYAA